MPYREIPNQHGDGEHPCRLFLSSPFRRFGLFAIAIYLVLAVSHAAVAQQDRLPSISIELVTQRGFALGAERKWIEALQKAGLRSVRVRRGTGNETPKVDNTGTEQQPRYRLTGVLMRGNRLAVPGRTFTLSQIKDFKQWVDRVRKRGPDAAVGKPEAFGLTAGELVKLHEQLAAPVTSSTKGRPLSEVAREITEQISIPIEWSAAASAALREADPCLDELKGISAGTGLAVALRPAGLTFVPQPIGRGRFRLSVVQTRTAKERWPIGWPPVLRPSKFAPALMQQATVEADKTRLKPTLDALSARTGVPFLLDHNSLALAGIDPDTVRVSIANRRTFYKNHIDRMLRSVKLKADLKMDEAGRPLLWITTARRP